MNRDGSYRVCQGVGSSWALGNEFTPGFRYHISMEKRHAAKRAFDAMMQMGKIDIDAIGGSPLEHPPARADLKAARDWYADQKPELDLQR